MEAKGVQFLIQEKKKIFPAVTFSVFVIKTLDQIGSGYGSVSNEHGSETLTQTSRYPLSATGQF
jgi:hypothetical protein